MIVSSNPTINQFVGLAPEKHPGRPCAAPFSTPPMPVSCWPWEADLGPAKRSSPRIP